MTPRCEAKGCNRDAEFEVFPPLPYFIGKDLMEADSHYLCSNHVRYAQKVMAKVVDLDGKRVGKFSFGPKK